MSGAERIWVPEWPCPAAAILAGLRRGAADPTYRIDERGSHWLCFRSPIGPATLRLDLAPAAGEVRAQAWGPGAEWALAGLPALLGAEDDVGGFVAHHDQVADAWRRHPHLRFGRTGLVFEALIVAIIEQKVTGQEAVQGIRGLIRGHGEVAPGPGAALGLRLLPDPAAVRAVPSWEWLRLHIDPARSKALVAAARVADSLERLAQVSGDEADRRLRSLPGIGVWTAAEVRTRALGDADSVSFGDYHLAKEVGWALLGHDIDDEQLAELLEPYRPHRGRVAQLLGHAGHRRPRRGPRMAPRTHLPARPRR